MGQTHGQVANVDVIWSYPDVDERLNELLHDVYAVVNAVQEHRLVAEGDTRVGEHGAGAPRFLGDLVGMVEVGVQPNGMIFLEHIAEGGSDPLRADDRGAAADTDDLHVGDLTKLRDDVLELFVRNHERVAAGKQNVPDLGMVPDVLDAALHLAVGHGGVVLTGEAAPRAVTAVHGALVGHEEEHTVGIPVGETRNGRIGILMQRIKLILRRLIKLQRGGDRLTPYGIIGIVRIYKGEVIRGYRHAERAQTLLNAVLLLGGELDVFFQILKRLDAVGDLPLPVVPKLIGNILEKPVCTALIDGYHSFFLS